jgi:hypothetical protein
MSDLPPEDPLWEHLAAQTRDATEPFTLLCLGDALPSDTSAPLPVAMDRLYRLGATNPLASVRFVPGEAVWNGAEEWPRIRQQEKLMREAWGKDAEWQIPSHGCPGPEWFSPDSTLTLMALNSTWFLRDDGRRPSESDAACPFYNSTESWDEVDDFIEAHPDRNILVAGHHPVLSYGQYAGFRQWRRHLFPFDSNRRTSWLPLPILGSFYKAYRHNIGFRDDLTTMSAEEYSRRMKRVFMGYDNLVYVSAHENDLQVLRIGDNYFLNSGSMSGGQPVSTGPETMYASSRRGYMELAYFPDGAVSLHIHTLVRGTAIHTDTLRLFEGAGKHTATPPNPSLPVNDRLAWHWRHQAALAEPCPPCPPTVSHVPGPEYDIAPLAQRILGRHYRRTWATPVDGIPVLRLDSIHGGLRPFAIGGGGQTKVLKFEAADGEWYYFRSVNKDPTQSMSDDARLLKGWYGALRKDLTSGQYPYGAFVADPLMKATGILHTSPVLYSMPDHPALGKYRESFANMLGMLEQRPRGKNKGVPGFAGADKVVKTVRMFQYLVKDHDNQVDQASYAHARLMDLLIDDWDRQHNNWTFAAYGDNKSRTFLALPKDRDKAFSRWEGIFWLADREFMLARIAHFGYSYGGIMSLTYQARDVDRFCLNGLDRLDWQTIVRDFTNRLPDSTIVQAVRRIPEPAFRIDGPELTAKLLSRRDQLPEAVEKWYRRLSEFVQVVGSNKRELFLVERLPHGPVNVRTYKLKKNDIRSDLLYQRRFLPSDTREIRLYGLGGKDRYQITGQAHHSIPVRIILGEDPNMVSDSSLVRGPGRLTKIYNAKPTDTIRTNPETKLMATPDPIVFSYRQYEPHRWYPMPTLSYNRDDGLISGMGANFTRQGFNKPGFAARYQVRGAATTRRNFWFSAAMEQRRLIRTWDLLSSFALTNTDRTFRRFYGFGNHSILDREQKSAGYYDNETFAAIGSVGLRKTFWHQSEFRINLFLSQYQVDVPDATDAGSTIYRQSQAVDGLGRNNLSGYQFEMDMDLTDRSFLPRYGVRLQADIRHYFQSFGRPGNFAILRADFRWYETVRFHFPMTIGLRSGYQYNLGSGIPFFLAATLGQKDNLRGFVRNRFAGDRAIWFNTDIRFDLGTVATEAIPIGLGAFLFSDAGKVWYGQESAPTWHKSLGAGAYLSPVNDNFQVSLSVARSREEKALLEFTLGFRI